MKHQANSITNFYNLILSGVIGYDQYYGINITKMLWALISFKKNNIWYIIIINTDLPKDCYLQNSVT